MPAATGRAGSDANGARMARSDYGVRDDDQARDADDDPQGDGQQQGLGADALDHLELKTLLVRAHCQLMCSRLKQLNLAILLPYYNMLNL